jgi:WD40 repeat protein
MRKKTYTWKRGLLLLLVLLFSCTAPGPITKAPISPTQSATNTMSIIASTSKVTYTPESATQTPNSSSSKQPTPTHASIQTEEAISVCTENRAFLPPTDDFGISGTIVYQHYNPLIQSQLPITQTAEYEVYGFSPDGKWLAYAPVTRHSTLQRYSVDAIEKITGTIVLETPFINLLSASGEQVEQVFDISNIDAEGYGQEWPVSYLRRIYGSWLNNRLLQMELFFDDPIDPYSSGLVSPKILDPFTGTWQDEFLNALNRSSEGIIGLSPDTSRVLFEKRINDEYAGFTLQDTSKDQIFWSDPTLVSPVIIRWSPDSSMVVISYVDVNTAKNHILLLDRNGEQRYELNSGLPLSKFRINDLDWSPDSQLLAMVVDDGEKIELYIYDISASRYLYSCPVGNFIDLIWSPDSKYIAFSGFEENMPLEIWDMKTGKVVSLIDNAYAVGWSDKFPTVWP